MSAAKNWCFTINNPEDFEKHLFPDGLPGTIGYIVWQVERGDEGTEHVQGFIQFLERKRMNAVKAIEYANTEREIVHPFSRAHLEVAKGTPQQAAEYCKKPETRISGPYEMGALKGGRGSRTDLIEAAKSIMDTGSLTHVSPDILLKYGGGCFRLLSLSKPPRRDDLKVFCIKGETGIGKSWLVHDLFPDVYAPIWGNSGSWWDGYMGEEVVMLEEYRGQMQLQKLLQILDPYPLRLEVKGATFPARYKLVFITCNAAPTEWYENALGKRNAELDALYRRIGLTEGRYIDVINTGILGRKELYDKVRAAFDMYHIPWILHSQINAPITVDLGAARAVQAPPAPPRTATPPLSSSASTTTSDMPPLKRTHAEAILVSSDSDEASDDDEDAQSHDVL